ncbi:MAG: hypothetical protein CMO61_06455 [Verrucomicrobiales bacterium]|nr:hypothetical protein [Verrucomicrobiales bacterium]
MKGSTIRLAVLNPKGTDPFVDYTHGPGSYHSGIHPPINYHAFAAATFGAFYDSTEQVIDNLDRYDAVLVLIRKRTWISLAAAEALKDAGATVIIAWKECGDEQINQQLRGFRARKAYGKILSLADGILSPTSNLPPRHGECDEEAFQAKARFLPTPYPLEHSQWDFSPPVERRGILLGTREFKNPARNHLRALELIASAARELNLTRVTVINSEKARGLSQLKRLASKFPADCLEIFDKPLPYLDYISLLASHRLVFQMDQSNVPGQVAGDCLLARNLCCGGNSAIEKIVFPNLCDDGNRSREEWIQMFSRLLGEDHTYERTRLEAQSIAKQHLSYSAVSRKLGDWNVLQ